MNENTENPNLDRWELERCSGYLGYRCNICGTWVYADRVLKCKCNEFMQEYTVIIVSYEYESYFCAYISAKNVEEAKIKGVKFATEETGIPNYRWLACFDGLAEQADMCEILYDWRNR